MAATPVVENDDNSVVDRMPKWLNQMSKRSNCKRPTTLRATSVFQCQLKVQKSRTENTGLDGFGLKLPKKVVSGTLAYCMWSLPHVPYGCKDLGNPPSPHLTCPEPNAPGVAQLREGSIGEPGHGTGSKLEKSQLIYIYYIIIYIYIDECRKYMSKCIRGGFGCRM